MRKTIEVAALRNSVNLFMESAGGDGPEDKAFRRGVASLLEQALFSTDNYHGFHYIKRGGKLVSVDEIQLGEYDESRRYYRGGNSG